MKFLIFLLLSSCSYLKKDNKPQGPISPISQGLKDQASIYLEQASQNLDSYGLIVSEGSSGDSALFSCIARFSGITKFNPSLLFTSEGRPLRHPDIYKYAPSPGSEDYIKGRFTTISKDMVNGILWCLYDYGKENRADALSLTLKMIDYGRSHKDKDLWVFCTDEDRTKYNVSDERWYGRCVMTPAVTKDTYRVAIHLGWDCDTDCKIVMATTGINIPTDNVGFERHLSVITTVRNGLVDGAVNDNSLKIVLESAANAQPRNAIYQASYALFNTGDFSKVTTALSDTSLFPRAALPTAENYCTHYLFQRDDVKAGESTPNPDWLPCGTSSSDGRGIEWLFAYRLISANLYVVTE